MRTVHVTCCRGHTVHKLFKMDHSRWNHPDVGHKYRCCHHAGIILWGGTYIPIQGFPIGMPIIEVNLVWKLQPNNKSRLSQELMNKWFYYLTIFILTSILFMWAMSLQEYRSDASLTTSCWSPMIFIGGFQVVSSVKIVRQWAHWLLVCSHFVWHAEWTNFPQFKQLTIVLVSLLIVNTIKQRRHLS